MKFTEASKVKLRPLDKSDVIDPNFSQAFLYSLGNFIDEEMSISSGLNREMFDERNRQIQDKADEGAINLSNYKKRRDIDWDRAAKDLGLQRDSELNEQRNALLAQRRERATQVADRGNAFAGFLGTGVGAVSDPVGLATMPFALPLGALRGLSVASQIARTAAAAGGIAAAEEAVIQPLVYQHKNQIGSQYEISDAIENIAAAAVFGSALGAVGGGISGYLRKQRESAIDANFSELSPAQLSKIEPQINKLKEGKVLTEADRESLKAFISVRDSEEVLDQLVMLDMYANDLDAMRAESIGKEQLEASIADIKARVIGGEIQKLIPIAGQKLDRGTVKALKSELRDLEFKVNKLENPTSAEIKRIKDEIIKKEQAKGASARIAKARAKEVAVKELSDTRQAYEDGISRIRQQLDVDDQAAQANKRIVNLEQGKLDEDVIRRIQDEENKFFTDIDADNLRDIETKRQELENQLKIHQEFEDTVKVKAPNATKSQEESKALSDSGLLDDYNRDIQAFKNLDTDVELYKVGIDGEETFVSAKAVDAELEKQLEDIESVMMCVRGSNA